MYSVAVKSLALFWRCSYYSAATARLACPGDDAAGRGRGGADAARPGPLQSPNGGQPSKPRRPITVSSRLLFRVPFAPNPGKAWRALASKAFRTKIGAFASRSRRPDDVVIRALPIFFSSRLARPSSWHTQHSISVYIRYRVPCISRLPHPRPTKSVQRAH